MNRHMSISGKLTSFSACLIMNLVKLTKFGGMPMVVNVYEAKTNMSKLMRLLETGQEKEIIVCNRGTPVLRWVPINSPSANPRPFGILKGKYPESDPKLFFELDDEIAEEFEGE